MASLPSSTESLMRSWMGHQYHFLFLSWNLRLLVKVAYLFKWGWDSDPSCCPPHEGCKPESMSGTLADGEKVDPVIDVRIWLKISRVVIDFIGLKPMLLK